MRPIARTLMFLACLLYGAMPGLAAMDISVPGKVQVQDVNDPHLGHAAAPDHSGDPCPHKGSMNHTPFCAACLVLVPGLAFVAKGAAPHAAPRPDVQPALTSSHPTPPLPPPRV